MPAHPTTSAYRSIGPGQFLSGGRRRDQGTAASIWEAIEAGLAASAGRPVLTDGTARLDGAGLLRAVEAFAWPGGAPPKPGARIGLHLRRGIASVIATLAIWRAGAVYVPIAPDMPRARIEAIAARCALELLLTDAAETPPGWQSSGEAAVAGTLIRSLATSRCDQHGAPTTQSDAPCYIAHTSGSTGDPKGVIVPHGALLNRLAAMRALLGVTGSDVFLYKTQSSFDVHVWEFTLPLVAGALCVVYDQPDVFDLGEVSRLLCDEGVSVVGFVPVLLRALLRSERFRSGNRLRAILCGGEAWTPALARAVQAALPGRALYNSYGPAETTISVANWRVPEDGDCDEIEIGAPLDNILFLVEAATSGERGVTGRLLIGGAQLALGYAEPAGDLRFVERVIDGAPTRFYDTGDLVHLVPETGRLIFAGRQDGQVKINGVRIELREVEEAMEALDDIEQAVAFLGNAGQLCCAYTTNDQLPRERAVLAALCARTLPGPLVPAAFRHLATLPLTPNGKVDRKRLEGAVP